MKLNKILRHRSFTYTIVRNLKVCIQLNSRLNLSTSVILFFNLSNFKRFSFCSPQIGFEPIPPHYLWDVLPFTPPQLIPAYNIEESVRLSLSIPCTCKLKKISILLCHSIFYFGANNGNRTHLYTLGRYHSTDKLYSHRGEEAFFKLILKVVYQPRNMFHHLKNELSGECED